MSNLETKAQTARTIEQMSTAHLGSEFYYERKWVPLEDAQKEISDGEKCIDVLQTRVYQFETKISELKTANDFLTQENQTLQMLVAKIEAAKQILTNKANSTVTQIDEEGCPYQHPVGLTPTEQTVLDALLNPRIEKQETADPVAELMKQGKC
jgi:regulator of replication initiation timing